MQFQSLASSMDFTALFSNYGVDPPSVPYYEAPIVLVAFNACLTLFCFYAGRLVYSIDLQSIVSSKIAVSALFNFL